MTGTRRSLAGASAGLLLGAVAAVTGGQARAWAAAGVVDDADIAVTDGAGPAVTTFKLRGRTLTKLVSRAEDGSSAGQYRAVLAAGDSLRRDLAAMAGADQNIAPPADSPAASFVLRRASGETRVTTARPPSDALVAGVTPLPLEWLPISEPAGGRAVRVLKLGKPMDIPLRAPVPATGPFSVRAVLAGTVVLRVPSASDEELAMTLTSRSVRGDQADRHRSAK